MLTIRIDGEDIKKFVDWADKNQISHTRESYKNFIEVELESADCTKWRAFEYGIPLEEFQKAAKSLPKERQSKKKEKSVTNMDDFIKEFI